MAHAYSLCASHASGFHDSKHVTPPIFFSYCRRNLKVPNFPTSHNQYKTFLHTTHFSLQNPIPQVKQALNSLQNAKLENPDAKSAPWPQSHIWVNPRSPRAKLLRKQSYVASSSLVKLAKSRDACDPSEQQVSEILKRLGDNVTERDAVLILSNMGNPDTALLAVKYFQQKIKRDRQVILYNVTLKLFRDIRDFERAEKLFDEMLQSGVKPSTVTFSTLISCATMCSLPHKAVEWFEKMPSFGCELDGKVSSSMIYAYASIGNVDMALSLYDRAKTEKWNLLTVAFSSLIRMYGKSGNCGGCLSVYNDMKVLGVKPNMETYNNLLYSMGREKRAGKAKAIYEE